MTHIARLRVAIDEVAPAVVRRVEVPLGMRLDDLHFVLQIAIGWQNCHPFDFRIGDKAWGLVDRDAESNPLPAEGATLADVFALGRTFKYGYVFGEDWQHTVEIEAVAPAEPGVVYPRLVEAYGRCPPADIGGAAGYEVFVSAIADPRHPLRVPHGMVEDRYASGIGPYEAKDHLDRRRLSGPVRAEESEDLSLPGMEGDAVEHLAFGERHVAPEPLLYPVNLQHVHTYASFDAQS